MTKEFKWFLGIVIALGVPGGMVAGGGFYVNEVAKDTAEMKIKVHNRDAASHPELQDKRRLELAQLKKELEESLDKKFETQTDKLIAVLRDQPQR